jgi:hypothetical protein
MNPQANVDTSSAPASLSGLALTEGSGPAAAPALGVQRELGAEAVPCFYVPRPPVPGRTAWSAAPW